MKKKNNYYTKGSKRLSTKHLYTPINTAQDEAIRQLAQEQGLAFLEAKHIFFEDLEKKALESQRAVRDDY